MAVLTVAIAASMPAAGVVPPTTIYAECGGIAPETTVCVTSAIFYGSWGFRPFLMLDGAVLTAEGNESFIGEVTGHAWDAHAPYASLWSTCAVAAGGSVCAPVPETLPIMVTAEGWILLRGDVTTLVSDGAWSVKLQTSWPIE